MCADGGSCRELGEASVSKRERKGLGLWACLWRVWSAVCWLKSVAAGGELLLVCI